MKDKKLFVFIVIIKVLSIGPAYMITTGLKQSRYEFYHVTKIIVSLESGENMGNYDKLLLTPNS